MRWWRFALIGIPSMDLPIALAGQAKTPELSLAKKSRDEGVAKIGITAYDAKTGVPESFTLAEPIYGFSNRTRWVVLSLFDWTNSEVMAPPGQEK
jgi:hypothetical protein